MDKKTKQVGIMGGTFDPVHMGHMLIAEQSYRQYGLDYVIFMPAGHPPHKQDQNIAGSRDRLAMLRLATQDIPYFRVSDYEIKKKGLSYTFETLSDLSEKFPETQYYFIMGADSIKDMDHWRHPEIILKLAHILAAVREDTDLDALEMEADKLRKKYHGKISILGAPEMDISSRELRSRISTGQSIRFMVPEKVRNYIDYYHLYRS